MPLPTYNRRQRRPTISTNRDKRLTAFADQTSAARARLQAAMAVLADLRGDYQRHLCAEVLGTRSESRILNIADGSSKASREIATRMVELLGHPTCQTTLAGQTVGNEFTRLTMEFLRSAFSRLAHLRPGDWFFAMNPSESAIALFEQYGHLADLKQVLDANRELATSIGSDYLVTPDIIVGRQPVLDDEINSRDVLLGKNDETARRSPLRASNAGLPILHASISCKYTMRSDRAQNTRTEALNLMRNRKGRNPHIVAVTVEPMAGRIASIAMGTGDVDCTYHAALDELLQATRDLDYSDAEDTLQTLIQGRRLRDISDLPLDLAT